MGHRFVDMRVIHQRMADKDDRVARALRKPLKGEALLERRKRRAETVKAEQSEMQAALKRDGHKCRWPGCGGKHSGLDLPIDACHEKHRGMGGNAKGDRTTRAQVVALCREHHGLWDACLIDLQPLTGDGFDGIVAFYEVDPNSGLPVHVCSEVRIGVPETRGL